MAGMTTRRNSPFSPFSEKFDAEILPSPFIGEEENGGKKRRPEKDPFDARVVCPDCQHLAQRKRCMNWKAAGLRAPEVAAGIKAMRQHCPGFAPLLPSAQGPPPAPAPTPRPTQTEARPTATEPPQPVQPILKGHDMALTVSGGATGTYTPPEAGTFPARCCALIDLGTQTATYEGETKAARKILVSFEITDSDNRRDDGSPHIVSKRFTASLHPKAGLRKFLEAWRCLNLRGQGFAGSARTARAGDDPARAGGEPDRTLTGWRDRLFCELRVATPESAWPAPAWTRAATR